MFDGKQGGTEGLNRRLVSGGTVSPELVYCEDRAQGQFTENRCSQLPPNTQNPRMGVPWKGGADHGGCWERQRGLKGRMSRGQDFSAGR